MSIADIIALAAVAITIMGAIAVWAVRISKGETASARVDRVEKELADFKERVARDYATAAMLTAVEKTVADAFNRLSDRIDRLLEQIHRTKGD